jgi:uncharacterized YigZ family protein
VNRKKQEDRGTMGQEQNMPPSYRTVYTGGEGKYEEKKSVFIATVRHVETEEEAVAFIDEMKKKYWDARHNCSAYVLGSRSEQMRASDDGEPQGTAGRPILDVLTGASLTNAAVVVTRYFGGVLLGTGGLVRAYTQAARDGIDNSVLTEKIYGTILEIGAEYTDVGKLQYFLAQQSVPVLSSEYLDKVSMRVILPAQDAARLIRELTEATAGRTDIKKADSTYYCEVDGEIIM